MMTQPKSMSTFLLPLATLWLREVVRFYRQRDRIVGALATPLVFWLLIGSGLGASFRLPSTPVSHSPSFPTMSYLEYFFPGVIVMMVLFTAIFSSISIIEDRREGFLQSVLVAPIPRASLVLGKLFGGTTLAVVQGFLFLLLAPTLSISLTPLSVLLTVASLFLVAFSLTGLGFCIAWRMDSTQGFHAIMNVFLMPMWLLSGAVFPASGAPVWLQWVVHLNPLTYGVAAVRRCLYWNSQASLSNMPSLTLSVAVTALLGLLTFAACAAVASRRTTGGDLP